MRLFLHSTYPREKRVGQKENKRIGAQSFTLPSSESKNSENMPRKFVVQVITKREAKFAKKVGKTGSSTTLLKKKRKIISSDDTPPARKKAPPKEAEKCMIVLKYPLPSTFLMWQVKRPRKVKAELFPPPHA